MAKNQDARPFVDLQKDAEEFLSKFEDDIEKCKSFLDSKITTLICDPDSLGNSVTHEKNPLVEFSRAKYAIFISVKSLMNDMEKEWIKYIAEMKKLFLENVEIFLAGTKLEVKLPSSEYQPLTGPKKSPGYKKSTSVTSSLYPIFNSITKNIPALSSPLRSKEVLSSEYEETETVVLPRNRSFTSKMEIDEIEMDLNTSRSSSKSRRSTKLDSSDLNTSWTLSREKGRFKETSDLGSSQGFPTANLELEDEVMEMQTSVSMHDNVKGQISQSPTQNIEGNSLEDDSKSQGRGNKRRSAAQNRKLKANGIPPKNVSSSDSQEETSDKSMINRGRNRRGKQSAVKEAIDLEANIVSEDSEETSGVDQRLNSSHLLKGRKRRGIQSAVKEDMETNIISEDSEETSGVDQRSSRMNSRKSVSRASSRNNRNVVSKKGSSNTSDESEEIKDIEINANALPVKGRRGKQASKNKGNAETLQPVSEVTKAIHEEEFDAPSAIPQTRRGRSAIAKNSVNIFDAPPVSETQRGRSLTTKKSVITSGKPTTRVPRKSVGRKTMSERISESEASVSPKRVIYTAEDDINDDLDVYTPFARPTKSAARRKTMLPSLDEAVSKADIIPGNASRGRSKRKTISVSDSASVAPSKRLKTSSNQKNIAEDEGVTADDNLLEENESYSEWIALKSVDGKIPTSSAIYEVKVWRAKKSAYIGSCESLRQTLTLHKLRQNSGHKHLDKFIERNYDDIQVRYEVVSSINDAKVEVKNRINKFVAQYKTTPAYN